MTLEVFTASEQDKPIVRRMLELYQFSDYWKAFTTAGFVVVDFEEPRITADNYHLAKTARGLKNSKTRPYSVAFKLQKKLVPAPSAVGVVS